jgi:hypothetical protein
MTTTGAGAPTPLAGWDDLAEAIRFAGARIVGDRDPLNEREAADGQRYVLRILAAVSESSLLTFDPRRPAFMPMLESVRHLGAAGPDIDYDVAVVVPGTRHRVSGRRGEATYVGICVYAQAGENGASAIVASVDVDDLVDADGSFTYEFAHPEAARVIVRQYFHDRDAQRPGTWTIDPVDDHGDDAPTAPSAEATPLPTTAEVAARIADAAGSIRWNAQLNQLWTPELRATPNRFVRQTPEEIVAAVSNPDVTYAFSWWRVHDDEALVLDLVPPDTPYWALQVCDRWFQSYPERHWNLNDRQVTRAADGSVRFVLSHDDPGAANWVPTHGHRTGTMFFRWLHADPEDLPTCRVVPVAAAGD